MSPSEGHIFKTVSKSLALVMAGAATPQRTAAVPAMAPGAARLSPFNTILLRNRSQRSGTGSQPERSGAESNVTASVGSASTMKSFRKSQAAKSAGVNEDHLLATRAFLTIEVRESEIQPRVG